MRDQCIHMKGGAQYTFLLDYFYFRLWKLTSKERRQNTWNLICELMSTTCLLCCNFSTFQELEILSMAHALSLNFVNV